MPLASIVITVYKRTTFLRECVQSVLSQKGIDRNDLEIIIVSNTNVSSYDLSVDQIIYTEDRSIGKKLLLGINASHSEILFLLEDDDYFFPKKIKTILPFFTDANVGYVHNNVEVANDGKEIQQRWPRGSQNGGDTEKAWINRRQDRGRDPY